MIAVVAGLALMVAGMVTGMGMDNDQSAPTSKERTHGQGIALMKLLQSLQWLGHDDTCNNYEASQLHSILFGEMGLVEVINTLMMYMPCKID